MKRLALLLVLLTTCVEAQTRTSVATDDFNRASLGANWGSTNPGSATPSIQVNVEVRCNHSNQCGARWIGAGSFTDDQYSTLELGSAFATGEMGPAVRMTADTNANRDHYTCNLFITGAGPQYPMRLKKTLNGTETLLDGSLQVTPATGKVMAIEVVGNTLKCYYDGTLLYTVTDSTSPITTGLPGWTAIIDMRGDNWVGGNMVSGGGGATPKGNLLGVHP